MPRIFPHSIYHSTRSYTHTILESDPEIFNIIENEKVRQKESLALIPSENFTSIAVLEALGTVMQNKYSEGYPGARYYGGNEFIDQGK
jgi:glycine hydroxymethyltransferase